MSNKERVNKLSVAKNKELRVFESFRQTLFTKAPQCTLLKPHLAFFRFIHLKKGANQICLDFLNRSSLKYSLLNSFQFSEN